MLKIEIFIKICHYIYNACYRNMLYLKAAGPIEPIYPVAAQPEVKYNSHRVAIAEPVYPPRPAIDKYHRKDSHCVIRVVIAITID